jgi:hypothetical protein
MRPLFDSTTNFHLPVHDICASQALRCISSCKMDRGVPMCSHSAPDLIIRLHSAVSWLKSEASTDGEMIACGMAGEDMVKLPSWDSGDRRSQDADVILTALPRPPPPRTYKRGAADRPLHLSSTSLLHFTTFSLIHLRTSCRSRSPPLLWFLPLARR